MISLFGVLNKTVNKGAMNKLLKFHTNVHNTIVWLTKNLKTAHFNDEFIS